MENVIVVGMIVIFMSVLIGLMWICFYLLDRKQAIEIELAAWRTRYSKMEYNKRWGVIVDKVDKEE